MWAKDASMTSRTRLLEFGVYSTCNAKEKRGVTLNDAACTEYKTPEGENRPAGCGWEFWWLNLEWGIVSLGRVLSGAKLEKDKAAFYCFGRVQRTTGPLVFTQSEVSTSSTATHHPPCLPPPPNLSQTPCG